MRESNQHTPKKRLITPQAALLDCLAGIGIALESAGSTSIIGEEGAIASPHRLEAAMAVAAAAQGTAIASIWRRRSGVAQEVTVDITRAAHAINPSRYLRQNNYPIGFDFTYQEPGNGFFRTRDKRWVYLVSTRPHLRNGLLQVLNCANEKSAIAEAVSKRDGEEIETTCAEHYLPVTLVRSPEQWRANPHGAVLLSKPLIEIEKIKDGPAQPFHPGPRPLSGIRALDVSHILAGPGLVRTLAEHGADALRISAPWQTDPINFMIDTGFGKRSAFLNLNRHEDKARLLELAARTDVFVQSYSPGSFDRRDLAPHQLAAAHPGLVYVSLSCFGAHGPWNDRVGFDHNSQSATGISFVEGGENSPQLPPTTLVADYITAYLGALGTLVALQRRATEGGSYHVRVSLARTCMWVQSLGYRTPALGDRPESAPVTSLMDSPFGELRYLAPITEFSATKAKWESPPLPFGASRPEWNS